jgi:uncharacterized glyoxalase superfamily protein PhnB
VEKFRLLNAPSADLTDPFGHRWMIGAPKEW